MRTDRIEYFILAGLLTVAEAREMSASTVPSSVTRDLRDNLLIHLCAYPLGEAGPRSGLTELEVFGRALARERAVWEGELRDTAGRVLMEVAGTVTRETREQARWDLLSPLGAPSTSRWQTAINVYTRVIGSRVVDGLLHPALAADDLRNWPIPRSYDDAGTPGVLVIRRTGPLFESWVGNRDGRDEIERELEELFRSNTWGEVQREQ